MSIASCLYSCLILLAARTHVYLLTSDHARDDSEVRASLKAVLAAGEPAPVKAIKHVSVAARVGCLSARWIAFD